MVFAGVHAWQTRGVPAGLAPDLPVVVITPDGAARHTTLAEWRALHPGSAVALHFWADWCPVCRLEQDNITRVGRDWPVLTVGMQSGGSAKLAATLRARALPWSVAPDADGSITRAHGFAAVPAFAVVAPDGTLRSASVGYTSELGMRMRLWWSQRVHR